MSQKSHDQGGFSAIETVLVLVFVGVIGFVGWYVYHSKQSTTKVLSSASASDTATKTVAASTTATAQSTAAKSNVDPTVQSDLNSLTSTISQNDKDLSSVDSSLNDQSTFSSVPQ